VETMESEEKKLQRRALLKALTAIPAAALVPVSSAGGAERKLSAPSAPALSSPPAESAHKRKILDEREWKSICVLSDLIIPADDRTGSATQAGVPEFIDAWLDLRRGDLLAEIQGGLTWLDVECNRLFSHDFVDCSDTERKQILDRIAYPAKAAPQDASAVAFFNGLRDLVLSGFFSSKMGVKDLPYLGNTMVADWEGCPPEVLAKLGL
jgi:gluconate 2-dehydrogenase gamma chain